MLLQPAAAGPLVAVGREGGRGWPTSQQSSAAAQCGPLAGGRCNLHRLCISLTSPRHTCLPPPVLAALQEERLAMLKRLEKLVEQGKLGQSVLDEVKKATSPDVHHATGMHAQPAGKLELLYCCCADWHDC